MSFIADLFTSHFKERAQIAIGVAEIAIGISTGNPFLVVAGASQVISGVGTMLSGKGPKDGQSTTIRNSVAPWRVIYGQQRVGGTLIYANAWGDSGAYGGNPVVPWMLDLVIEIACHPCLAIDEVLFDQQRVQIDTNKIPTNALAGYSIPRHPDAGSGTSFTPLNNGSTPYTIDSISRNAHGLVTVVLHLDIPYLTAGDQIKIRNVTGDLTLNGTFQVQQIISRISGVLTFQYLNGGAVVTGSGGQAVTLWPDYNNNVYFEPMLGTQALGETFAGMTAGTPFQGGNKLVALSSPGAAGGTPITNLPGGQWTRYCSGVGRTAVFLRLQLDRNGPNNTSKYFKGGIPQFSFLVRGKCDIYDPDTDGRGYTANAALCIADALSSKVWGFGAEYGTEIPYPELVIAKNICAEPVDLANGGTESRYECHGSFELTGSPGDILQNMLTSCGGRLTYNDGKYVIQAAKWVEPIATAYDLQANAVSPPPIWKPTVSIRDLYNGVKGTFIAPNNLYQSTDFPRYSQDVKHGYAPGVAWDDAVTYSIGDMVVFSGISYVSLVNDNLDNLPVLPSEFWALTAIHGDINVIADGGKRRWLDIQLPFTTSYTCAQRLAKIELLRRRWQADPTHPGLQGRGTGTFTCNMSAYQFVPLDIIKANCAFLGWENKELEISAVRLVPAASSDGKAMVLSVELDVVEVDSGIYSWSDEEEQSPQGYQQIEPLLNTVVETVPYPWSPGHAVPLSGDFLEGTSASFGIMPFYGADAAGTPTATLQISGYLPITAIDQEIGGPQFHCSSAGTGSSLRTGTYVIGVSAWNNSSPAHANTDYLTLQYVSVLAGETITVTITQWQSGDAGGEVFMAEWAPDGASFVFHRQALVPVGATSLTISSFNVSTPGGPDPIFNHLSVTWQQLVHAGCWAQQVFSVTSNTITINGDGMTLNQWAGYTLSLLAKFDPSIEVPILNMPIASSTASASTLFGPQFVLTIGPNALGHTLPDLTTLIEVFDLVTMRFNPTFTATTFSDPNIVNGYYPTGVTGDLAAGKVAIVLSGPDKGDVVTVDSVTSPTEFTLSSPWKITPNSGDIVIICDPAKAPEIKGARVTVPKSGTTGVVASPRIENLSAGQWLFTVRAEDSQNEYCPDNYAPNRELYIFGSGLTRTVASNTTQYYTDGRMNCDTSAGNIIIQLLPEAQLQQMLLMIVKISDDPNTVTVNVAKYYEAPYSSGTTLTHDTFADGTTTFTLFTAGASRLLKF